MGIGYSPLHKGNIYTPENLKSHLRIGARPMGKHETWTFRLCYEITYQAKAGFWLFIVGDFLTDFSMFQSLIAWNKESLNVDF